MQTSTVRVPLFMIIESSQSEDSMVYPCRDYFTVTEVMWGLTPLYQYRKPSISTV